MHQRRPRLDRRKHGLRNAIERYISERCPKRDVLVFLSGSADSTTVALAAHHIGKRVTALSFRLGRRENPDCAQAIATSQAMGWNHQAVDVDLSSPKRSFVDLFECHGCRTKTEAECLFPFLSLIPRAIELGYSQALSGFGCMLPTNRKAAIECARDPKGFWDHKYQTINEVDSPATAKIISVASELGLDILLPLRQRKIVDCLYGLTTPQMMGRPYQKHHYKDLYYDDYQRLSLLRVKNKSLQVAAGVEQVFAPLLDDPEINFPGYKNGSVKLRLSALCKAWGKRAATERTVNSAEADCACFAPYKVADVIAASEKRLFTVVSTFAGGGGSSTGYRLAGGHLAFINEFIQTAVDTYKLNYPDTPIITSDIRKLNRGREYVEEIFHQHGIKKRELDILDGSPPCSTFSSSGKGKAKIEERDASYSETTQHRIGMLIHDFVFMGNVMQPRVCIIENVPLITSSDVFRHACDRLRRAGYLVGYKVLVSSHFGVPQRRKRLFTLAVRADIATQCGIRSENDIVALFPVGTTREPKLREALAGVPIDPREREALLTACRRSSKYEIIRQIPVNPSHPMTIKDVRSTWKSDFNLVRSSWEHPCPTITVMGAQLGRSSNYHPDENRVFTIAELKRITGLPDDFKLTGTFDQRAERIGRMVPPLMTTALARAVYEKVLSKV